MKRRARCLLLALLAGCAPHVVGEVQGPPEAALSSGWVNQGHGIALRPDRSTLSVYQIGSR
jgi:hypothetical protein